MAAAPVVAWTDFRRRFACHCRGGHCGGWHQGEHVSLIGPTGTGKTTLGLQLLDLRAWVVALATKPKDSTMSALLRRKWRKVEHWDKIGNTAYHDSLRVVLWPKYRRPEDVATQRQVIDHALREAFAAGGWCVFADELLYLTKTLGLGDLLDAYWTQGRSVGLSLVGCTQRPAHVSLHAYSAATHLFLWRDNDARNLDRIGGLGATDPAGVRKVVATLPRHSCLYLNTRTGDMIVTRADRGI